MVNLQDMMVDSLDLPDNELRALGAYITDELKHRAIEKEKQERKKVMKAIQDFIAAGYSLYVSGKVECEGTCCHAVLGEVRSVEIENDEVVLKFIEQL